MTLLLWIVVFCLLGGILSVLAAALFLVFPEAVRNRLLPHLVSFATGALLGAAMGHNLDVGMGGGRSTLNAGNQERV